ncbi:hypothetical protein [Streptomyces doudnae]|uniref:Uncharacterized protein n=1 Tax=Streptomyces doudnae TaxID=3075536 RepID=A0ABD5EPW3_9ACTN|nr:hypothetical protein [Streptomyces sp. DSM 41981]MDT0435442.1 hypothetical protein [Streptomyces sp. DSM 41981]
MAGPSASTSRAVGGGVPSSVTPSSPVIHRPARVTVARQRSERRTTPGSGLPRPCTGTLQRTRRGAGAGSPSRPGAHTTASTNGRHLGAPSAPTSTARALARSMGALGVSSGMPV